MTKPEETPAPDAELEEDPAPPAVISLDQVRTVGAFLRPFFDEPAVLDLALTRLDLSIANQRTEALEKELAARPRAVRRAAKKAAPKPRSR